MKVGIWNLKKQTWQRFGGIPTTWEINPDTPASVRFITAEAAATAQRLGQPTEARLFPESTPLLRFLEELERSRITAAVPPEPEKKPDVVEKPKEDPYKEQPRRMLDADAWGEVYSQMKEVQRENRDLLLENARLRRQLEALQRSKPR